ncbi:hypothetical protein pb186bvf_003351 [Paramecium bursaria]
MITHKKENLITPLTYKVDEYIPKPKPKPKEDPKKLKAEKAQELYYMLKSQQFVQKPQKMHSPKRHTGGSYERLEKKKLLKQKLQRDQAFEHKKKQALNENKNRLKEDINSMEKISMVAFKEFHSQINIYNKYYSNYIGDEMDIKEVNKEDLNISENPRYQNITQRYTYKQLLNYQPPENHSRSKNKELEKYLIKPEQLEVKRLQELSQQVNPKLVGDFEQQFFYLVKENDIQQIRNELIHEPALVNIQDISGQTPLHWAAKKNNYDLCVELISRGANVFIRDIIGRSARDVANKFDRFKIAKLIQQEEMRCNLTN